MYAVVRIRGTERLSPDKEAALQSLNLTKPNHCILVESLETLKGTLALVKDYITWGEVDAKTAEKLSKAKNAKKIGIAKTLVRLNPPVKGHGRKGIKLGFNQGGSLGYHGAKINALLEKMIAGTEMSSATIASKKMEKK